MMLCLLLIPFASAGGGLPDGITDGIKDIGRRRMGETAEEIPMSDGTFEELEQYMREHGPDSGRRRMAAMMADAELCNMVTQKFGEDYMDDFLSAVKEDDDDAKPFSKIASKMKEMMMKMGGRRRMEGESSLYYLERLIRALEDKPELEEKLDSANKMGDYLDVAKEVTGMDDKLPAYSYDQAAAYAALMEAMLSMKHPAHTAAAASAFGAMAKGSAEEKEQACASIVTTVNKAMMNDEMPGVSIGFDNKGKEIVVVEDESLKQKMAHLLTSVTLAGGVVVQKLMWLCHTYDKMDECME